MSGDSGDGGEDDVEYGLDGWNEGAGEPAPESSGDPWTGDETSTAGTPTVDTDDGTDGGARFGILPSIAVGAPVAALIAWILPPPANAIGLVIGGATAGYMGGDDGKGGAIVGGLAGAFSAVFTRAAVIALNPEVSNAAPVVSGEATTGTMVLFVVVHGGLLLLFAVLAAIPASIGGYFAGYVEVGELQDNIETGNSGGFNTIDPEELAPENEGGNFGGGDDGGDDE